MASISWSLIIDYNFVPPKRLEILSQVLKNAKCSIEPNKTCKWVIVNYYSVRRERLKQNSQKFYPSLRHSVSS